MKLFDVIPTQFFNLLSSPNKVIYSDCLFIIYKATHSLTSFGIEREILMDYLSDYFEGNQESSVFDEDEEVSGTRNLASYYLRKLKESGWIDIEDNSNYVQTVNLKHYAIKVIETFDDLIKNEGLEYQGYVYAIYALLFGDDRIEPSVMLEQVYENTKKLMSGLKTLNANIKTYMNQITKLKTADEIMSLQFNDYETNVIDKGYHRLKTSDNVSKFRPRIIERLEQISRDQELILLISNQLVKMEKAKNLEDAHNHVLSGLYQTIEALTNIDDIIHEIDRKNNLYLRASLMRVKFVLNSSKDLGGQINAILKYLVSLYRLEEFDLNEDDVPEALNIFEFFPQSFIDSKSLYVSTEGKKAFIPQPIDQSNQVSKEERLANLEKFKEKNRNRLTPKVINAYVMALLKDSTVISSSQLPLETMDDFIKIIYIRIYSQSRFVGYTVKPLNGHYLYLGYEFSDFEIWRK